MNVIFVKDLENHKKINKKHCCFVEDLENHKNVNKLYCCFVKILVNETRGTPPDQYTL